MKPDIQEGGSGQTENDQRTLQPIPREQSRITNPGIQTRSLHHDPAAHAAEPHPVFIAAEQLSEQTRQVSEHSQSRYGEHQDEHGLFTILQADSPLSHRALPPRRRSLWN